MSDPMNLNTNTYVISDLTNVSQQAALTPEDANQSKIIIDNPGTTPVFVVSGGSTVAAVFPTSASVPLQGKVVAPGSIQSFTKNINHTHIAAIRESATADLYISIGSGE